MRNSFSIYNQRIAPGEHKVVEIPMPQLYDSTPMTMPVHVIRGKKDGPVLCITAAIHGDELNGTEIVRRVLKRKIVHQLSGTLIAIPIVNMYGFLYQDRYLMDRRDLNRCFPGSKKGSLASRLAYIITHEILNKATHCIDLHTGSQNRTNLPQIRANTDDIKIQKLARAFNPAIILDATLRKGSLRAYACKKEIPLLLYEGGEALRFDEFSIKTGVKGILNVMHYLGMIQIVKEPAKVLTAQIAKSSYWVRASHSGIIHPKKLLGSAICKGDILASIGDPTGTTEYKVYSPIDGIVIGKNNAPMIHEGAAIFNIATFKDINLVTQKITNLQKSFSSG